MDQATPEYPEKTGMEFVEYLFIVTLIFRREAQIPKA
jgi:hypothetical protein